MYTYPENFRAYKAQIAAKYSGAKVDLAKDFKFGETNKSEAFLAKFPLGKVTMIVFHYFLELIFINSFLICLKLGAGFRRK